METVLGCIITAGCSLISVIITNNSSNKKIEDNLECNQKVTETKIEELTREVREHNNFAKRVPVVEEQIKDLNSRVEKLENKK